MKGQGLRKAVAVLALLIFTSLILAACGGKENLTQQDIEKQAFDDLRMVVEDVIEAPEREQQALAQVDMLQQDFVSFRKSVLKRKAEARRLNADYDATRQDFDELRDKTDAEILRNRNAFASSHRELKAATTAEEWALIAKTNTKTMAQLATSLRNF